MFVLIVSNGYPTTESKRGIFAMDQAKALKTAGHKVAFIAMDLRSIRRRRPLGYQRLNVEGIDVFTVSLPLGRVSGRLPDAVAAAGIRFAYKKVVSELGRPDIIHAHFYDMGIVAGVISKENNIPLVITEHFSGLNNDEISEKLRNAAVKSYSNADELIAVSREFAGKLHNNTGFDFRIVSNIVDMDAFSDICPAERDPGDRAFSFISVGNLRPIKGHRDLLEAFSTASRESAVEMELTIVGQGPERESLERQAGDLGISDKVFFKGQLDRREIAELYRSCDAFVLLSRAETFGVAYIEAMAAGLPVIATACGGPNEFVDDSNGIMVPVGDKEAYVKALLDMAENAGKYDSEKIRKDIINRFSPEIIAEELDQIYEDAILRRRGS